MEVDKGVTHIGFRFNPESTFTRREQQRNFAFTMTMRAFAFDRLERECREHGIRVDCAGDLQNLHFWINQAVDELFRGEVKGS